MVKISAFRALRPIQNLAPKVPTKPYLNYSEADIIKEKNNNPYSFLNIIHQNHIKNLEKRFKKIRNQINKFISKNIFTKDKENCLYIYRQSNGKKKYTGLICAIDLRDYKNTKIKIHEKTIQKRELLFTKYLQITKIHAEPVLITYNHTSQYINKKQMCLENKLYEFKTKDKIKHEIWRIKKSKEIKNIVNNFQNINNLYIADGHHRMASSSRLTNNHHCLAYIVPKDTLCNYPFHRVVKINEKTKEILKNISNKTGNNKPKKITKNIQFYLDKTWYEITTKQEKDILKNLSTTKLFNNILEPIFAIKSEKESQKITFIPGNQSMHNILKSISKKEALFWMNKISIETIIEIANQNQTTPPKSTFILPKIPSGLIMMELK